MAEPANIEDLRLKARRHMPRMFFDYLDGGALSEATMRRNRSALEAVLLRQRVWRDVGTPDLATRIMGEDWALPFALGPVGFGGLFRAAGEKAAARVARDAGIPFCLSNFAIHGAGDVARAAGVPPWLQIYLFRDESISARTLQLARDCGVTTLVVTVDGAAPGIRERDARNGFRMVEHVTLTQMADMAARPRWLIERALAGMPQLGTIAALDVPGAPRGVIAQTAWFTARFDPAITADKLRNLRRDWQGRLLVKGVMAPEDARLAADCGVDGIVVSNHGGRQLDGTCATIEALPPVAAALAGWDGALLMDGGIRRGTDVLRALALGADGVLLGRAWAYGLAAGGARGVEQAIALIRDELRVALALCGLPDIAALREERESVLLRGPDDLEGSRG